MIDLHCHLLPAVDDGARDVAEALAMIRLLADQGFTGAAPSPHAGLGPGGDVPQAVAAVRRAALVDKLTAAGIDFALWANAEHHVTVELFDRIDRGEATFVGDSRWLLAELPWQGAAVVEEVIFRLQSKGVRPLLAHPERYEALGLEQLARIVARGARLQVELGSFVGLFDRQAEQRVWELCDRGLAHVIATDLHHLAGADTWLPAALRRVRRDLGDRGVTLLLDTNPRRILADAPAEELGGLA